jgi:hypothetical protein
MTINPVSILIFSYQNAILEADVKNIIYFSL